MASSGAVPAERTRAICRLRSAVVSGSRRALADPPGIGHRTARTSLHRGRVFRLPFTSSRTRLRACPAPREQFLQLSIRHWAAIPAPAPHARGRWAGTAGGVGPVLSLRRNLTMRNQSPNSKRSVKGLRSTGTRELERVTGGAMSHIDQYLAHTDKRLSNHRRHKGDLGVQTCDQRRVRRTLEIAARICSLRGTGHSMSQWARARMAVKLSVKVIGWPSPRP